MWGRSYRDGTGLRTDSYKNHGVCCTPTFIWRTQQVRDALVPNGLRETTDLLPPARAEDGLAYDTRRSR